MPITLNMNVIAAHPEHISIYKLCIAGVGFLRDGKYQFISHEGGYIGSAPVYRVEPFIAFMKRRFGLKGDPYPMESYDITRPLTYGWQGLVDVPTIERWMNELFDNPVELV